MNFISSTVKTIENFKLETFLSKVNVKNYTEIATIYPLINKVAIVFNHIMRSMPLVALLQISPCPPIQKYLFISGTALFYRVTVERLCSYKFALMSSIGAIAFDFAKNKSFNPLSTIPLFAYAITVIRIAYTTDLIPRCPKVNSAT